MSLCEGIVEIAEEQAALQHYSCVKSIRLELGRLSCAEPAAMCFAFDAVAKGTIAEGARLAIEASPGIGWCSDCENEVEVEHRFDACPACGTCPLEIRGGDAMRIIEMEVE